MLQMRTKRRKHSRKNSWRAKTIKFMNSDKSYEPERIIENKLKQQE